MDSSGRRLARTSPLSLTLRVFIRAESGANKESRSQSKRKKRNPQLTARSPFFAFIRFTSLHFTSLESSVHNFHNFYNFRNFRDYLLHFPLNMIQNSDDLGFSAHFSTRFLLFYSTLICSTATPSFSVLFCSDLICVVPLLCERRAKEKTHLKFNSLGFFFVSVAAVEVFPEKLSNGKETDCQLNLSCSLLAITMIVMNSMMSPFSIVNAIQINVIIIIIISFIIITLF